MLIPKTCQSSRTKFDQPLLRSGAAGLKVFVYFENICHLGNYDCGSFFTKGGIAITMITSTDGS